MHGGRGGGSVWILVLDAVGWEPEDEGLGHDAPGIRRLEVGDGHDCDRLDAEGRDVVDLGDRDRRVALLLDVVDALDPVGVQRVADPADLEVNQGADGRLVGVAEASGQGDLRGVAEVLPALGLAVVGQDAHHEPDDQDGQSEDQTDHDGGADEALRRLDRGGLPGVAGRSPLATTDERCIWRVDGHEDHLSFV